ncbi:uncharacterized protein EKO05_0011403 [Ascochyta rabiei]|uniref:Uncharacterized protein n=1 Tax=Didymella rabiei TaxID=5454 RepID=A0A163KAT2_DIDRA|nr:uncharacterized protein EKO05_0011403 [Ascochyta rabiei]KZM26884.1 hypothetical protein ST47_g1974 [Ascochyta rabiei]UPX21209.1 hypothetical protein EKO05_0011403 [Ascochyta rabiei]
MSTPNLDTNQWYSMYVNNDNRTSLLGTNLYNRAGTTGAVFFNNTNPDIATQRWQIYPINATAYVLRCKASGANGFIGTQPADAAGAITPLMLRGDVADNSVFWRFGSWGDGTWYLWNSANGTEFHFAARSDGLVTMDKNISAPQNKQRWGFDTLANIDDKAYSSVTLLSTTITSPAPTSSSSLSTDSTSPRPSSGLSTAGKASLGGVLGLAAVILLLVLALLHRRRRLQKRTLHPQAMTDEPFKAELDHDSSVAKYEMAGHVVTELGGREQTKPVELPGHVGRR